MALADEIEKLETLSRPGFRVGRCVICTYALEAMDEAERQELLDLFTGRIRDRYGRVFTDEQIAGMLSAEGRLGVYVPWFRVRNCRIDHHGIRRRHRKGAEL